MQIKSSHCRSTKKAYTAGHVFAIPGFWTPEASEPGYRAQGRADLNIPQTSACAETSTTPGPSLSQGVPRSVAVKMVPASSQEELKVKEIVALTLFSDLLLQS